MPKKSMYSFFMGMLLGALSVILIAPDVIPLQERPHSLFVYGTLQNNLIRFYACLCLVPEKPATLPGYEKIGLNIVPSENNSVSGSIIRVSAAELERIDNYENVPERYLRKEISVEEETHWVYVKTKN